MCSTNSPDFILALEEMKAVTRAVQPARIARWFRENGFVYKLALDGYPVVSRAHFEKVMGGAAGGRPRTEPNREALLTQKHTRDR